MAAVETAEPRARKKGKKHKKRRIGIRIDMTPMVDIAFLLLTFFMLTTQMTKPQTMEINLPPSEAKVEVAESNLLTIRVATDGTIFWNMGIELPQKTNFAGLVKLLQDKAASNPKLIVLLKVDRKARYNDMVDIMDQLNLAGITRFSLAPLLDADKKLMQKAA
jgi:biopolymer transport protein ExbD